MDDGYAVAFRTGKAYVRQVHGIEYVAVLYVVDGLAGRHYGAVDLGLRSAAGKMRCAEHLVHLLHARSGEVCCVSGYLAAFESVADNVAVDYAASREVSKINTVLHKGDGLSVYHALGLVVERGMHGNHVRVLYRFLEAGGEVQICAELQISAVRKVGIVAYDLHSQVVAGLGHARAYVAHAYYSYLLAHYLRAAEPFLAGFHYVLAIGGVLVGEAADPGHGLVSVAHAHDYGRDGHFLYGVGVAAGAVDHADPLLGAAIDGDVVDSRAAARDYLQIRAEFPVVDGHGADQYGVRVFNVPAQCVFGRVECVCTFLGDVVKNQNVVHRILLDGLRRVSACIPGVSPVVLPICLPVRTLSLLLSAF